MKSLNTQSTLIIKALNEAMYNGKYKIEEGYAKINNSSGFMPVVVEQVGSIAGYGPVMSVAHYGEQNGDLMANPEMTFTIVNGEYYPVSFRNDYIGRYQEVFEFNHDGVPVGIRSKLQAELADFGNLWMKNIQEQQAVLEICPTATDTRAEVKPQKTSEGEMELALGI